MAIDWDYEASRCWARDFDPKTVGNVNKSTWSSFDEQGESMTTNPTLHDVVHRIRMWLVLSDRYNGSTIELEERLTREIAPLCGASDERAAGSRVPSPPADVADALDSARVWKEHYPYYTTGGAGQAYTAFLSVWSILGKLEAALRAAVVAAQEPKK